MYQLNTKLFISQNMFVLPLLFAWRKDLTLEFAKAFR